MSSDEGGHLRLLRVEDIESLRSNLVPRNVGDTL